MTLGSSCRLGGGREGGREEGREEEMGEEEERGRDETLLCILYKD